MLFSKGDIIMEALSNFISSNPIISVIIIVFITALILFFTFKSLSKLVMILFVIFLVGIGYYYFKDPEGIREYCASTLSGITDISEKRKTFVEDSQEVFKRTKEAPGQVNKLLDTSRKELNK
jgi:uncharacterized membrane protein